MAAKKPLFETPLREYVPCAFDGCTVNAIINYRTKIGYSKVCEKHAMKLRQDEANAYCKALGLNTPKQCRDWLLKNKLGVKRAPVIEREPGEDLEEAECPL